VLQIWFPHSWTLRLSPQYKQFTLSLPLLYSKGSNILLSIEFSEDEDLASVSTHKTRSPQPGLEHNSRRIAISGTYNIRCTEATKTCTVLPDPCSPYNPNCHRYTRPGGFAINVLLSQSQQISAALEPGTPPPVGHLSDHP